VGDLGAEDGSIEKKVECRNVDFTQSYEKDISPSAMRRIIIKDIYTVPSSIFLPESFNSLSVFRYAASRAEGSP
jgi:hypothetical protein